MRRYGDKSIRHRPAACAECDSGAFRVIRTDRKLVDADTTDIKRKFRCLGCRKVIAVKTRVVEKVISA